MPFFERPHQIPFVIAGLWSFGASLFLLASPMTIHGMTGADDGPGVVEFVRQASFYEIQGLWGVFVLLIFAFVFALTGLFAVRDRTVGLAATSLLAVTLTCLALFSIGAAYLPAAFAVLAGWLVLGFTKLTSVREEGAATD